MRYYMIVTRMAAEGVVKDKLTKEVEAESIAYVVCNHFGLDTSEYSFLILRVGLLEKI